MSPSNIINLPNLIPPPIMKARGRTPMPNRVYIFDTTLRDGEQSPGCSMTVPEKVRMAAKLMDLGVDILEAAKSLKNARRPRIHTFIATSDIHLKYKFKKTRPQILEEAVAAVSLAREYCDDVEFSAEDATRTDWDYLEEVCKAVVAAGARTVNLPDTVGYSVPEEYAALIGRMT